jgi:hypothetical protein
MICAKLLWHRRQVAPFIGSAVSTGTKDSFGFIIEIFAESAVFYTVAFIVFLTLSHMPGTAQSWWAGILSSSVVSSPAVSPLSGALTELIVPLPRMDHPANCDGHCRANWHPRVLDGAELRYIHQLGRCRARCNPYEGLCRRIGYLAGYQGLPARDVTHEGDGKRLMSNLQYHADDHDPGFCGRCQPGLNV